MIDRTTTTTRAGANIVARAEGMLACAGCWQQAIKSGQRGVEACRVSNRVAQVSSRASIEPDFEKNTRLFICLRGLGTACSSAAIIVDRSHAKIKLSPTGSQFGNTRRRGRSTRHDGRRGWRLRGARRQRVRSRRRPRPRGCAPAAHPVSTLLISGRHLSQGL
jgi:hypothetical protein